jgi:hypothetical protein
VHITDLHVGRSFNENLWQSFETCCTALKPHAIIVTGDLVDTPYRWTLLKARTRLRAIQSQVNTCLSEDRGRCELVVIPGNHDTRLTGLVPIGSWMVTAGGGLVLILVLGGLAWLVPGWQKVIAMLGPLCLAALYGAYRAVFPAFAGVFGGDAPKAGTRVRVGATPVEILPFDSSTLRMYWARGEVPISQFMDLNKANNAVGADAGGEIPYRIALVHHHPLPIPYDHWAEPTLILRNAGAFLRVIMRSGVRLVLHGHKHRWNFARVAVDAETGEPGEIAILGGYSLTGGTRHDGTIRWGFNLLTLNPDRGMQVTPYTSEGGPFMPGRPFYAEDVSSTNRTLNREARRRHGVTCRLMAATVTVCKDGDAQMRIETRGFRVIDEATECREVPSPVKFDVDQGHLEMLDAGLLDGRGPAQTGLKRGEYLLTRQTGSVDFGRNVSIHDEACDFFTSVHMINSFAMSASQYRRMYPNRHGPPVEWAATTTPAFPCDTLQISVQFPPGFTIEGSPELEINDKEARRFYRLEARCRPALRLNDANNTVTFSMDEPPPETDFLIRWRLGNHHPPDGKPVMVPQGRPRNSFRGSVRPIGAATGRRSGGWGSASRRWCGPP